MKRRRFTYNTETFQYEPIEFNRKKFLGKAGLSVLTAVGLFGGLLFLFGNVWRVNPHEYYLEEKNRRLEKALSDKLDALAKIEVRLEKLHLNDNNFYRSLLDMNPMELGVWNAGQGGAAPELAAGEPELVYNLNRRFDRLNYKIRLQRNSFKEVHNATLAKAEQLRHLPAMKPIKKSVVSRFGPRRNPFHGRPEFHPGVDFQARVGTPILATGDGVVIIAGNPQSGYGRQVELDHGYGYRTKYAHLSQVLVKRGDKVNRGDIIGLSGNTGYSTGPHLHYEVIKQDPASGGWQPINPEDFFYTEYSN